MSGTPAEHCDQITDAINRVLDDLDTGGRIGGSGVGGNVRPAERIPQPEQWGLTPAEADALRESGWEPVSEACEDSSLLNWGAALISGEAD